jgi:uncharacterized protein (DUF1501 family)
MFYCYQGTFPAENGRTAKEFSMAFSVFSKISEVFFAPAQQAVKGDVLVCIFQRGGMDGLNVVVPLGDSDYYRLRPTIGIQEPKPGDASTALDLDGFFGLHPALSPLLPLYQQGSLAAVHAVGLPDPTHSHFDAQDNLERGTLTTRNVASGWLGRHLAAKKAEGVSPLRAVGFGPMLPSALRGPQPAVALQSLQDFHLTGRLPDLSAFQQSLTSLYTSPDQDSLLRSTAEEIQAVIEVLGRVHVSNYQPANGAAYPQNGFGGTLKQTAQLIKADVGVEVICIDLGGWDTHANEGGLDGVLDKLLADFGKGLASFYADMGDRMQNVLVVTMSEFGRRAQENASHGTDHGHGNAMLLLGGGVNGKKVYGQWPGLAAEKLDGPGDLAATSDMRDVLGEALQVRLQANDLGAVFPDYAPKPLGILKPVA